MMRQVEPQPGAPIGPLDWFKLLPFAPAASSDRLGWAGLEAARNRAVPGSELHAPAITHHRLILFSRPPEGLDLLYEGVKRHVPPPAGAILVVPAGSPVLWRWSGSFDSLHIFLEPELFARVGAEAFGLDPARVTLPPLDGLDLPHLRTAMLAVDAELTAGGTGDDDRSDRPAPNGVKWCRPESSSPNAWSAWQQRLLLITVWRSARVAPAPIPSTQAHFWPTG